MQSGEYRHYKGQCYWVQGEVTHSETGEALVIYRCLYGDYSWWARPAAMFNETVTVEGIPQPRFAYVGAMSRDQASALAGEN